MAGEWQRGGSNPSEHFLSRARGMLPSVHVINSQKASQSGIGRGDDRLWRLRKGTGPCGHSSDGSKELGIGGKAHQFVKM